MIESTKQIEKRITKSYKQKPRATMLCTLARLIESLSTEQVEDLFLYVSRVKDVVENPKIPKRTWFVLVIKKIKNKNQSWVNPSQKYSVLLRDIATRDFSNYHHCYSSELSETVLSLITEIPRCGKVTILDLRKDKGEQNGV